jgi:predicted RNase H-like nuclease
MKKQQLPYKVVAGVTPCATGWLVTSAKLQGVTLLPEDAFVLKTLEEVIDYRPSFTVIALDMPIGLPDDPLPRGFRACDREARDLLGWPRRAGVDPVPSRKALGAGSFEDAQRVEPWISPVEYRRFKWIRETEEQIQPYRQRTVYSVNPELTMYLLNSDQPMRFAKHSPAGFDERLHLLNLRLPGIEAVVKGRTKGASRMNLLDAAAVLWTARRIAGKVVSRLPQDPEWDSTGLRMELVR